MKQLARSLAGETSGVTLPMVAMMMTAILGFTALTVDLGNGYLTSQRLQSTADAAAMAAADRLATTNSEGGVALSYARLNMPQEEHGQVLAANDVRVGRWDPDTRTFTQTATSPNAVSVTTRRAAANGNPLRTFLAGIIGIGEIDISRTAIAAFQGQSNNCIIALRPSGSGIVVASGGVLTANRCSIHANSSANNSMSMGSSGRMVATEAEICAVGGVTGTGYSPAARTRCANVADPLASLPEPTVPACTFTSTVTVSTTLTLNPGRYCRGIELRQGANVFFNPGVYIIEGGDLTLSAGASASGTGVTLIFRDKNATLYAANDSRLRLTAPTSGPYAGVAIYGSRTVTDLVTHQLNADTQSFINGAVYLPRATLFLNSRAQFSAAGNCMSVITWDLMLASSSSMFVDSNYDGCGVSPVGGFRKSVALVN